MKITTTTPERIRSFTTADALAVGTLFENDDRALCLVVSSCGEEPKRVVTLSNRPWLRLSAAEDVGVFRVLADDETVTLNNETFD